jgi:glycosyltransferase involved in cell wall biosynthesis
MAETFGLVVPIHNEAVILERMVVRFIQVGRAGALPLEEILLVENGSSDNTREIADSLAGRFPGMCKSHSIEVASYGAAIRHGILSSIAPIIAVLEIDLMDEDFLGRALDELSRDQGDFIIASKCLRESRDERPFLRRMGTLLFNQYLRHSFHFTGTDTHGLKVIRTPLAKQLCGLSTTDGEALQTELVFLASHLGFRVLEIPIAIREVRRAPVPILRRVKAVIRIHRALRDSLVRHPFREGISRPIEQRHYRLGASSRAAPAEPSA